MNKHMKRFINDPLEFSALLVLWILGVSLVVLFVFSFNVIAIILGGCMFGGMLVVISVVIVLRTEVITIYQDHITSQTIQSLEKIQYTDISHIKKGEKITYGITGSPQKTWQVWDKHGNKIEIVSFRWRNKDIRLIEDQKQDGDGSFTTS